MSVNRRDFLLQLGALSGFTLLGRGDVDPRASRGSLLIRHRNTSQYLETPIQALRTGWTTPTEHFFVLSRRTDALATTLPDRWDLRVHGEVADPVRLDLEQLRACRQLRWIRFPAFIQCAGYGRRFFEPKIRDIPWGVGAIGNAVWEGIPLADLLEFAGLLDTSNYVAFLEQDASLEQRRSYIKVIPIEKALEPRTAVVFGMNGAPLPAEHGGPLRMVVPGWAGTYSVKWLREIVVLEAPWHGYWMDKAYRMPLQPVQPGPPLRLAESRPFEEVPVNSLITHPLPGAMVRRGPVTVSGFAWSGAEAVTRVEVSMDDGRRWQPAQLEPVPAPVEVSKDGGTTWSAADCSGDGRYAWTRWSTTWEAPAGFHRLLARARDARAQTQPIESTGWNPGGYGWNAASRIDVTVL